MVADKSSVNALRDHELVRQAVGGDQRAYASLMEFYKSSLYQLMLKRVGDATVAEDLTLEALGKAFRSLNSYSPDFAFSTWLFRIATNHCTDFLRKQKKDPCVRETISPQLNQPEAVDSNPDPEEQFIREQRSRLMRETVARLKPHYRKLIQMRYFDELSYEEIATQLNLPLGSIKAQLFRSKELLFLILKNTKDI